MEMIRNALLFMSASPKNRNVIPSVILATEGAAGNRRPFDYWAYRIKSQYASDQVRSRAIRASREKKIRPPKPQ